MKGTSITRFSVVIFLCFFFESNAQITLNPVLNPPLYKAEHIHPDQGLSAPFVLCLYEDKYGFLWIGTQYGLDRWDGYSFRKMSEVELDGNKVSMEWIWSIYEDLNGILWVCSSNGLFKYDRSRDSFELLLPDPENPVSDNNRVLLVRHDTKDRYWIFTVGGLYCYRNEDASFTDYKNDSIIGREVFISWYYLMAINENRFLEDHQGNIWMTSMNGLFRYDEEKEEFVHFRHDPGDPRSIAGEATYCLIEDPFNNIWFTSMKRGEEMSDKLNQVVDPEKGVFRHFKPEPTPGQENERSWMYPIFSSSDSILWVGGDRKFYRFDYDSKELISYHFPGPKDQSRFVWQFTEEPTGQIWLTVPYEGLFRFNPEDNSCSHFRYDLEDPDNILQTNSTGLIPIRNASKIWLWSEIYFTVLSKKIKPFHTVFSEKFSPRYQTSKSVLAVYFDPAGGLWFGGGFGLYHSTGKSYTETDQFKRIPSCAPYSLLRDSEGHMWLGGCGLGELNENTGKIRWYSYYDHPDSLNGNPIYSILEDSHGVIWVAPADGGLQILDSKNDRFITILNERNRSGGLYHFYDPLEDRQGNIWYGSFVHGLTRLRITDGLRDSIQLVFNREIPPGDLNVEAINYQNNPFVENSLSGDQVIDLHEDSSGRIWIGTTNGLNLYNESRDDFFHFTTDQGLPDNCIQGILEDDHGNLWISSRKGIFKLELKAGIGPDLILSVQSFTLEDGLQGNNFYEKSCSRSSRWMDVFRGY